jgi:hypothetical protein
MITPSTINRITQPRRTTHKPHHNPMINLGYEPEQIERA